MHITLNNRPDKLEGIDTLSVQQLLELKNFSYKMLMVRLNDTTIKKEEYPTTFIKEGDTIAVIHLMTGG